MGSTVLLFPGQGAQYVGMGRTLRERYPAARAVFEAADAALGFDLTRLCDEGPAEALTLTAHAQPAILAHSIAALRVLEAEEELVWHACAGHSLGEWTALVAAGALAFEDAIRLVHKRGTYMQEAVPEGQGAMAAILGMPPEDVEAICAEAAGDDVLAPAAYNGPKSVVLSGTTAAVARAVEIAGERLAVTVPLPVSAPFHCALMAPAATRLAADLETVDLATPARAVISTVDVGPLRTADEVRDRLVRQMTEPVRWVGSLQHLLEEGVDRWIAVGPGASVPGQVKRVRRKPRVEVFGEFDERPV